MDFLNSWSDRTEEDIHACICEAYNKQNYRVTNLHETDRPHEHGVDIVCETVDELIHIQIKIKPRKNDIKQLYKLSDSDANKKIYVFVDNPTVSFKKEIEKIKNVDFWDIKKLHDFLMVHQSAKYFRYLFLSTKLLKNIILILEEIISCNSYKSEQLKVSQMNHLWLFKDRTVKLHSNVEHVRDYYLHEFLKKDQIIKDEIVCYLNDIFVHFEIINKNSSNNLLDIVKIIKSKCPQLLSQYINIAAMRSNWIGAPIQNNSYTNKNLRLILERWLTPDYGTLNVSFYHQMGRYLNKLMDVSKAIEDGVDWVFNDKYNK